MLKDTVKKIISENLRLTDKYNAAKAICEYLGLEDEKRPIGDEWTQGMGYKDRRNFLAQYDQFKTKVDIQQFPTIQLVCDEISSHDLSFPKEILKRYDNQLGKIVYIQNLFDLIKTKFDLLPEMDLYTTKLDKATINTSLDQIIIVKKDKVEYFKGIYNKLIQYSKTNGICKYEQACAVFEVNEKNLFLKLLNNVDDVCVCEKDMPWYIYENRNNYIYHVLGKILNVTEMLPIDCVKSSIIRTFKERPREGECPSEKKLDEYLHKSKYVTVNDKNIVSINAVEKYKLSDSEKELLKIVSKGNYYSYREIYDKMNNTQNETTIIKTIFHSPLLCYVKANKYGNYILVSSERNTDEVLIEDSPVNDQDVSKEISDVEENSKKYIDVIIKARLGQGKYRDLILKNRMCKCELCNISQKEILVASHIKEFAASNIKEAIDINNGLLLCANHDKLFDRHLISFDTNGKIIISKKIDEKDYNALGINCNMEIYLSEEKEKYMEYHRQNLE